MHPDRTGRFNDRRGFEAFFPNVLLSALPLSCDPEMIQLMDDARMTLGRLSGWLRLSKTQRVETSVRVSDDKGRHPSAS